MGGLGKGDSRVWVGVVGEEGEVAAERGGGREVTHTLFFSLSSSLGYFYSHAAFLCFVTASTLPLPKH